MYQGQEERHIEGEDRQVSGGEDLDLFQCLDIKIKEARRGEFMKRQERVDMEWRAREEVVGERKTVKSSFVQRN